MAWSPTPTVAERRSGGGVDLALVPYSVVRIHKYPAAKGAVDDVPAILPTDGVHVVTDCWHFVVTALSTDLKATNHAYAAGRMAVAGIAKKRDAWLQPSSILE